MENHRVKLALSVISLFLFSTLQAQGAAVDLQKSFDTAVEYNETLKIQEQALIRSREQRNQAVGSVLPKISAIGTYTKQDTSELTTSQRNTILEDSTGARINATQ